MNKLYACRERNNELRQPSAGGRHPPPCSGAVPATGWPPVGQYVGAAPEFQQPRILSALQPWFAGGGLVL